MNVNFSEFNDLWPLFSPTTYPEKVPVAGSDEVIIYPPTIDWSFMKQRPQQLMEQFALNGYTVYYCNKTQFKAESFTTIQENLFLIHDNAFFINHIVPWLKGLGKKILVWASWAKLYPFIDSYQPDFVVYDYLDDFPDWRVYLTPMVKRADLVTTTSEILQRQIQTEFPDKPNYLIPNGCDLIHFRPQGAVEKPKELENFNGPVITYSGAWAKWVDTALVYKIADRFPAALITIIGVEFGTTVNRNIPNLRYLGYKSYSELPQYLQSSTVCIIPFLIHEITIATNPIKMYEYLASGKPVVSTDIPEARGVPGVHIGTTQDRFLAQINCILNGEQAFDKQEINRWLASHTWEERFHEISRILKEAGFFSGPPGSNS
jgi:glycosyltransferase involved in cell wall biosynthesis